MRLKLLDEFWMLSRFSLVGTVTTVVHVLVAMIVVGSAGINRTLGSTIGFFFALPVSYLGHFRFTFVAAGRYRDYFLKFAVGSFASLLLSTIVVWTSTTMLKMGYEPTFIATAIVVPVCNYFINRLWVFLRHESDGIKNYSREII